ncbi:MAG: hypothetical protein KDJ16_05335 [Hyphomicrobiales bacterium]|nr:hypothetical protein [Hyphomicrobiales bacterium]
MSGSRLAAAIAIVVSLSTFGGAAAEDDGTADRYLLLETGKGVVRLDRTDGSISFCRPQGDDYVCTAAIDDRRALDDEIARLEAENARLRAQLAALGETVPEGEPDYRADELPSEEEIDRMMDRTERMMRRFFGIVDSLRREYDENDRL